jgi:hypothetical protein
MCNCLKNTTSGFTRLNEFSFIPKGQKITALEINSAIAAQSPFIASKKYVSKNDYYLSKFMRSKYFYEANNKLGSSCVTLVEKYTSIENELVVYDLFYKSNSYLNAFTHLVLIVNKNSNLYFPVLVRGSGLSLKMLFLDGSDGQASIIGGNGPTPADTQATCLSMTDYNSCVKCLYNWWVDNRPWFWYADHFGLGWDITLTAMLYCALKFPIGGGRTNNGNMSVNNTYHIG